VPGAVETKSGPAGNVPALMADAMAASLPFIGAVGAAAVRLAPGRPGASVTVGGASSLGGSGGTATWTMTIAVSSTSAGIAIIRYPKSGRPRGGRGRRRGFVPPPGSRTRRRNAR